MTESTLILPRHGNSVTLFLSQFPPLASSSFAHLVISEGATVKIQFYRLETSTPQQRPAATKWLQWTRSKWDLWINRGAALVDANDGKMDEPGQQRWRADLHFVSLQSPESGGNGGGVGEPSQHVLGRQWRWWRGVCVHKSMPTHPRHPPGLLVPACLSQTAMQRAPAASRAAKNTQQLQHAAPKTLQWDSDFARVWQNVEALDEKVFLSFHPLIPKFIKTRAV